ncbi:hypothetical protein [Myroides sp. DF42-4-2]|uniref:hypothetical protein n=1 Tax=unclassified Myroides TaxID=2642485 RepID=UPI00257624EA|nr:hypothetical protein [Myroides sp. DF42-4-2]MDM1406222.1 hypothetical protein [Myroides sp. DF42-4-2]
MKTRLFTLALLLTSGLVLTSCKEQVKENSTETPTAVENTQETTETTADTKLIDLTFASEGYATREAGSDWVKVNLKSTSPDQVTIVVSSREDIKKPTCSLETVATKVADNTYQAVLQNSQVNFSLGEGQLTIDTVNESDRGVLSFYCSGGGSLQGTYTTVD